MNANKLNIKAMASTFKKVRVIFQRYNFAFFMVLVVVLYAFLLLRVSTLSNAEPASDEVIKQVKGGQVTRIDPLIVKQLESLRDNSVSVQALFDQARNNPFQ